MVLAGFIVKQTGQHGMIKEMLAVIWRVSIFSLFKDALK